MDVTKFKSVKMSLMQQKSDIREPDNKADYLVKGSATFNITSAFYTNLKKNDNEKLTSGLLKAIYEELIQKINDVDTVGIWINYDNKIYENSIKIETLYDMEKYGNKDIIPIYELFKMSLAS
jgi:hypothetical protein